MTQKPAQPPQVKNNGNAVNRFQHLFSNTLNFTRWDHWLMTAVCVATLCLSLQNRAFAICLSQGYQAAVARDPSLREAQANIQLAKTKIGQAQSVLMPTLSYQYEWGRTSTSSDWRSQFSQGADQTLTGQLLQNLFTQLFGSPGGVRKTTSLNASITMPVFNLSAWYDINRAKLLVQGAEKQYDAARYALVLKVAEACIGYLQAKETWQTFKQESLALQKQAKDAKRGMDLGYKTVFDFLQHDAEYQRILTQEFAAQKRMEEYYRKYEDITGIRLPLEASSRLDLNLPLDVLLIPNLSSDQNLSNNIDYQVAILQIEAARQNLKKAQAEWLPQANIGVIHNRAYYANNPLDFGERSTRTTAYGIRVGGTLNPITYYKQNDAEAEIAVYEERARKAAQEWRLQRLEAVNRITASSQNIVGLKSAYEASRKAYYAARKAESSGFLPTTNVLQIEKTTSEIRQQVISTYFEILSNRLKLLYLDNHLTIDTLTGTDNLIRTALGH